VSLRRKYDILSYLHIDKNAWLIIFSGGYGYPIFSWEQQVPNA
jgi:hypothetical protein